jgi:protein-S-isoprenylcysteine O-methyltransferase Ste14
MVYAIIGYLLMAAFFGLEFFARQAAPDRTFKVGPQTRGTTILLGTANTMSTLISPLLNYVRVGRLPQGTLIAPLGLTLMVLGLSIRLWAILTLGDYYTYTLRVSEGQHLVDEGPYRAIRHPGYLGTLLTWIGLPLALSNWLSATLVTAAIVLAYRARIPAEEEMLIESFGDEYRDYMQRTARLLPFIF